jgi:uncharacterized protein YhaN
MRIARLALERYGHLSDVELAFPSAPGLHIVLGVNEAGKSTALAAIGDALFRFQPRTHYAFLHATRDLRLSVDLHAQDGRVGRFVRRKGTRDDLFDEAGQVLPESAIAAFLCGASRERFQHVFGLDGAALRQGGQAILEGKGEVGESILQAHTGLHGFRDLARRLGEEAMQLAGDRRATRALRVATDRFKEAKAALDERSVEPAAYKQARAEQEALEAARETNRQEAGRLHAERARLDRISRTTPARLAAARARAERAGLGEVPALPTDAEARRLSALIAREHAARDLARLREQEAALAGRLAAPLDRAVLEESDGIDRLAADCSKTASASNDRAERRIVAEQHERALALAAQRLGKPADAAAIAACLPDALTRDAARRAIEAHVRLADRHTTAAKDLDDARARHEVALAAVAASPEAEPFAELRAAIEFVRSEGRIDANFATAVQDEAQARAELARRLAALPFWTATAEALLAAPVPLDAMIAQHAAALEQTRREHDKAHTKLADHDATLAAIAADLAGLTEAGEPPTPQAIAALRALRDRAWHVLRRHRIDGGPAPSPEEQVELGASEALPDFFATLMRQADALVDRGAAEAKHVADYEHARRQLARARTARAAAAEVEARAASALAHATDAWVALWKPTGIVPHPPEAMREWMRKRESVLEQAGRTHQAAAQRAHLATQHETARAALATLLPEMPSASVASLLAAADTLRATREHATTIRLKALSAVTDAHAAMQQAAGRLDRTVSEIGAWREAWVPIAAGLGLPVGADAETGKIALDLWSGVDRDLDRWQEATNRIAAMTHAIEAFLDEAAAIAGRIAPELADADPYEAVRALATRLGAARAAAREHARLTAERDQLREAIAKLETGHAEAERALATLHSLAGTTDDTALQDAIARAVRHAVLSGEIATREAELDHLGDGKSPAELEAEAEGIDIDALPGQTAAIAERLRAIDAETETALGRLAELRNRLAAMEKGADAAGAAQEMQDAHAEIEDIAARYVRTRLAHTLLSAGINRFRQQQQGPLLARAGALFARLTEGRYERLEVDEEDGKLSIVAVRPDRSHCPAERLSEGTRDQLYLALRLAAIESYAERTEPLPFIADDLLVNFDDTRARAALRVLGEMGPRMQVILFTHHAHIAAMAEPRWASLHHLPPGLALAAAAE